MKKETTNIKDYKVLKKIAAGGMGKVYKAIHPALKSNVIIKELIVKDEELEKRFKREAKIMMALRHDNIVPVYDYFIENRKKYIVMEYVHGVPQDEVITKKGKLSPHAAVFIYTEIAHGLSYAHRKNVIHRDLKPHNILISKNGDVRIIDFSISSHQNDTGNFPKDFTTQTGIIIGTPAYMPPEQLNDIKDTTNRSDIYSLGIILYEMLTGTKPFGNAITTETITARVKEKYSLKIDDDTNSIPIPKDLFPRNTRKWNKHRKNFDYILPDKKQSLGEYEKNVTTIKNNLYNFFDDNYRNMLYNFQLQALLFRREISRGKIKDLSTEEIVLKPKNYIHMINDDFEIALDESGALPNVLILTSAMRYRKKGQYSLKILLNNQSYWTHFSLNSLNSQDKPMLVITNHKPTPFKTVTFKFSFMDETNMAPLSDMKKFIWSGRKWRWVNWNTQYANDEKKLENLKNGRTYNFLFTHEYYKNEQLQLRVGRDQTVVNIAVRCKKKN